MTQPEASISERLPTILVVSRSSICRRRSRTLGDRVGMHRDRKNLDTNARYFRSLRDRESVICSHISVGKMTPRPYQMVIRLVH